VSITTEIRIYVRQRAHFACEYCGVSEADTGGELTVDHFQPQARNGTDDVSNLLYCCTRCNQYKADYWPTRANAPMLWSPRNEPMETHLLRLTDGTLYALTSTGDFTLKRLRLNRPPLIAYRLKQQHFSEEQRLLTRYQEVVTLLEQLSRQQAALLEEQQRLLEEQRALLQLLLQQRQS
jgi:hypothetical protein